MVLDVLRLYNVMHHPPQAAAIQRNDTVVEFRVAVWADADDVPHHVRSVMRLAERLDVVALSVVAVAQFDPVAAKLAPERSKRCALRSHRPNAPGVGRRPPVADDNTGSAAA